MMAWRRARAARTVLVVGALALVCLARGGEAGAPPAWPPIAFFGVVTQPLPPQTGQELGLPEGAGLLVWMVQEQSPAQTRVDIGDILVRLDDQLLAHPYQFAVLVRTYAPGTEVKVSLLRGGNRMEVPVVLGERPAGSLPPSGWGRPPREEPPLIRYGAAPTDTAAKADAQVAATARSATRRTTILVENGMSYTLSSANGAAAYTVAGPDARVLFRGPVTTDAEKAQVPEAYRPTLEALTVQLSPGGIPPVPVTPPPLPPPPAPAAPPAPVPPAGAQ